MSNEILKKSSCLDRYHLSCAHATMRKLMYVVERAETSEFQDSGINVAVVGVRTEHWRQFVLDQQHADKYLESRFFIVTRPNGDLIFVVPVDGLPHPKVLDDREQEALLKRRAS